MFLVIWKFEVSEGLGEEFEKLYGQHGKWVALFKNNKGYIKTELIKEATRRSIYITIDYWESQNLYKDFLKENKSQFKEIDKEGKGLTKSEVKIGWFEVL